MNLAARAVWTFVIAGAVCGAEAIGEPQKPLVRAIAGVVVGTKTTDPDVVRMFGNGCFVDDEGHGGGRYFTDDARRVTLHTVIGVDRMTEQVELSAFADLPAACRNAPSAVSRRLSGTVVIEHGLHFGMPQDGLVAILGKPSSREARGSVHTLVYQASVETDPRVDLEYEARFRFVNDRLTKVSVYDGE